MSGTWIIPLSYCVHVLPMVRKYPWGTESTALNDSQPTKLSERVLNVSGPGNLWDPEVQYGVQCRRSAVNRSSIPLLGILICNNYLFIRCTCIRKILIFQIWKRLPCSSCLSQDERRTMKLSQEEWHPNSCGTLGTYAESTCCRSRLLTRVLQT